MVKDRSRVIQVSVVGITYLLAGVFFLSSVSKLLAPAEFHEFVWSVFPFLLTTDIPLAYSIATLEILIAISIFSRITRLIGVVSAMIALVAFTVVLVYARMVDVDVGCGCFGDLSAGSVIEVDILRNMVLVLGCGFLLDQRTSLQSPSKEAA